MSQTINIRLRRTVVISLVLFSIIITTGELMLFKSSLKRDAEHVRIVSLNSNTQIEILRARILAEQIISHEKDELKPELIEILNKTESSIGELSHFLENYNSIYLMLDFQEFKKEFEIIENDFNDLRKVTQTIIDQNTKVPVLSYLKKFDDLVQVFQKFNSLIPDYLWLDKRKYRTEIILVTILNTLIIILAGFIILRLASKLKKAERKLVVQTVEVENRERERIAADLHDGLGALLSGLMIHLQVLKKESEKNADLLSKLEQLTGIASESLAGLEETIYNLNPPMLSRFGLYGSLQRLIKRINYNGKTEFSFNSGSIDETLEQGTELLLFRICSELINNTLKHSEAAKADLHIEVSKKTLILKYKDDGKGFEYNMENIKERKSGINNIIQRVESMNGNWVMNTSKGVGVDVSIRLPLDNRK